MTEDEKKLAGLKLLKDNLEVYSAHCLKVKTKDGRIVPFMWNRAQHFVHAALEKQLAETNQVRALILKGRQQGMCLAPGTRVLTAELRWVPIEDVLPGQALVATDEETLDGANGRCMRTATVEAVATVSRPAYRITMDDGRSVVCSAEHRWLTAKSTTVASWRSIAGSTASHNGLSRLAVGDKIRGVVEPWGERGLDDAWFGGVIDGEGSLCFENRRGVELSVAQSDGPVLRKMLSHCAVRGFDARVAVDRRTGAGILGKKPVTYLRFGGMSKIMSVLGLSQPLRFLGRHFWEGKLLPQGGWRRIVSIESVGEMRLFDLQTSTKTFIAEGFVSHNSTYVGARFFHKTTMSHGKQAFIVAHEQKATDNLYNMVRRYHDHNPMPVSTGATNAKELIFDLLDGGYKLATAGTKDVGRSNTAQLLHGSEFGFWANAQAHLAGIGNTIASGLGTEVILESTGNGLGNAFHLMWQDAEAGKGEYLPIFVPWFWQEEYRAPARKDLVLTPEDVIYRDCYGLDMQQMQWRANKITSYGEGFAWLFDQEYPACVVAGTRVGTSLGMIKIEDVAVGMEATLGAIEASNAQPLSKVFKLTTEMGYEFRGTWDHPVFTAGGVLLPMMSCEGVDIRLQQPRLADEYHVERWRELGVDSSVKINEDFGLLLGLFMGDGSLYDGCISFCCDARDNDVVDECVRLLGDVLGVKAATRAVGTKGGGVEVRAQRKELTAMFDRLGLLRAGCGSSGRKRLVCVPESIWRSPRSVVVQFLRGLFESDGFNGYGHPRVTLFSKHRDFLSGVQLLLLALGITSRLGVEMSKKADKTHVGYSLSLRRNESILFNELIGFISRRKREKAGSWKAVSGKGVKRFEIAMRDRVTSVVEDGFEVTYDMTIRGGEAFDANGILTHNTAALAFQTGTLNPLISPHFVSAAAKGTFYDEAGALVIGCDPASDGAGTVDRTCIVFRRGRVVFRVEYHEKLNSMQVAGKLAAYYEEFNPDAMFVDKGGIGTGIVDRLQELNIPVIGVMFGEAASEPDIYANKKAEMWWRMSEWFAEQPNRIVNNAAFISDICAPQPDVSSNGRKLLESKQKLEKRQIRSPDGGDALALTFAEKVMSRAAIAGHTKPYEAATKAGY